MSPAQTKGQTGGRTGHMRQPGRAPGIPRRCRAGRPAVSPTRNL